MTPGFAVFILMNNYFHDVATAMLLACCIVLSVLKKNMGEAADTVRDRYITSLFRGITLIFRFSVLWIIVSGAVRFATFRRFEWFNATQKHFEAGLFVKYGIAAAMIIAGSILWTRMATALKSRLKT